MDRFNFAFDRDHWLNSFLAGQVTSRFQGFTPRSLQPAKNNRQGSNWFMLTIFLHLLFPFFANNSVDSRFIIAMFFSWKPTWCCSFFPWDDQSKKLVACQLGRQSLLEAGRSYQLIRKSRFKLLRNPWLFGSFSWSRIFNRDDFQTFALYFGLAVRQAMGKGTLGNRSTPLKPKIPPVALVSFPCLIWHLFVWFGTQVSSHDWWGAILALRLILVRFGPTGWRKKNRQLERRLSRRVFDVWSCLLQIKYYSK